MFFTDIPAVPLGQFLNDIIGLFSDVLQLIISQPFFAFLSSVALLFAVIAFASSLIRQTRNGK